ncbi:MAG: sulfite exporter TauE/SafE family protein, partial [Kosmotogaceae bacterium]
QLSLKSSSSKTFFVRGMHCQNCQLFVESKLEEVEGIKRARASLKDSSVEIEFLGEVISIESMNEILSGTGYSVAEAKPERPAGRAVKVLIAASLAIVVFFAVEKFAIGGLINVDSSSSLVGFFLFGLVAGISSCAALVGGLILSVSKHWYSLYGSEDSFLQKLQPHLIFHAGRLVSYSLFGFLLGWLGQSLKISLTFSSILVIAVSIVMFIIALQMLGIYTVSLSIPPFLRKALTADKSRRGRIMPFILGATTFFLPCGFTISAQALALLSGSPLHSSMIMFFFALGTFFPLIAIGASSIKFFAMKTFSEVSTKIAAVLIMFFVIYNVNSQLNVLGLPSLNDLTIGTGEQVSFTPDDSMTVLATVGEKEEIIVNEAAPKETGENIDIEEKVEIQEVVEQPLAIVSSGPEIQVIRTVADARGYAPDYYQVKAGVPVRWEIEDVGTSGCTNAIISRNLFPQRVELTRGNTSVVEFTPQLPGQYKFSCWMGHYTGIIEVVN